MELNEIREKILNIADTTIKYARDLNIPSAEAFVYNSLETSLSENKGKVDSRDGVVQGVGIRVAIGKQLGFSSCTGFSEKSIKEALRKAYAIAKASPKNPLFESFVSESKQSKDGILDPEVLHLTPEKLADKISELLYNVDKNDQRIVGVSVNVEKVVRGYAIGTTEGCLVSTLSTVFGGSAYAVVMKEGDRKTASEFVLSRKNEDISELGQKAVEKGFQHLGSKPFNASEKLPIVLHPYTSSAFLTVPFMQSLSGAAYVEKRNPLGDKLGKKIADERFNLIDNGQIPESQSTVAIDGEGSPVGKTSIIEKGILKTFLFDRMYAKAANTETTANASRGGMMGGIAFENIPSVSPRKLVVEPVKKNLEEQIAEIDKGIYIEETPIGLFTANVITGDFSITSNNAFLIEKGERTVPLRSVSIAGNYYQVFESFISIGDDVLQSPWPLDAPAVSIDNVTISG